jgi:hypothetical protein
MRHQLRASLAAVVALSATFAFAQSGSPTSNQKDTKPPAAPKAPAAKPATPPSTGDLPPGMDPADMQAYMDAGMPGPMHAHLAKSVGVWEGKTMSWMAPDAPPTEGTCVSTITTMMDGKFVRSEIKGDIPGMGAFVGLGINGYDNVSKMFQASWIDNMGTGMMTGTGTLSADGKVLTWNMSFYCPITKKQCIMREVDTATGPDSMKLEMFGPHPKTGKEFKSMEIVLHRKAGTGPAKATAAATGK